MAELNKQIEAQLAANAAGLTWAESWLKGEELSDVRESLINNRIELKRIQYASKMNPAAAVFGESQVGKSYLVDNLLKTQEGALMIYDGDGKAFSFIDEINPFGGGKESTALVSRFTTKQQWIDKDYPIKACLLKPIDVVLTLCDTFFNDVNNVYEPTADEVKAFINNIKETYGRGRRVQSYITEDDIYDMRQYFFSGVLSKNAVFVNSLKTTHFFEEVAKLIQNVDVTKWVRIFGYLWNNNSIFNDVFSKLINAYTALHFDTEVYIKMDAVLRKDGTILDVDRLFELFGVTEIEGKDGMITIQAAKVPDMQVLTDKGVVTIDKSSFCALTAELVFKVDEKYNELKPFLKGIDILDFPGARSRLNLKVDGMTKALACQLVIRGKVAYLFNKYSQQYLISNLLFCHHREKSEVTTISDLLQGWVHGMIGKTDKERSDFMRSATIPPLFIVCTKFNTDLAQTPADSSPNSETREEAIKGRWVTRFTNLQNLIGKQVDWLDGWTAGEPFRNMYLLRAYDYSTITGIYEGYMVEDANGKWALNRKADGTLSGETGLTARYKDFLPKLETAFWENDFVSRHFERHIGSSESSWSKATDTNKDGSQWIIDNLTISSGETSRLREQKFTDKINGAMRSLCSTLYDKFHDDDSDKALAEALLSAGEIDAQLDLLFGMDKYFFSDFINTMLIKEDEIHDTILDVINSVKVVNDTDLSKLFAIRNRANIDPNVSDEENRERVKAAYHFNDTQLDMFLENNDLRMEDIINPPKIRNLARIIVDAVESYWMNTYLNADRFAEFIERGFREKLVNTLLSNIRVLYAKLKLTERMTNRLQPYIADQSLLAGMAEMLADICAEMLNKFINSMGTAYFEEYLWDDVNTTVTRNDFGIKVHRYDQEESVLDNERTVETLNTVFDVFENVDTILNEVPVNTEKLSFFSNYHAFHRWTDMLKIAFLATCGIPKYDVNMNNQLRTILVERIAQHVDLQDLIRPEYKLSKFQS